MTTRARPGPRPVDPVSRRLEIARLITRLDDLGRRAREAAATARVGVEVGGLARYRAFAKSTRDFFALASVVDEKIVAANDPGNAMMSTALDQLHTRALILFIEESAAFFEAYVATGAFPIGAREMCGLELRGLLAICRFLEDERYDGERGAGLRARSARIADLMNEVMEKVPPLPDFGDLPSVGPRGAFHAPIKARA